MSTTYTKYITIENNPDRCFEFADKYLAADKNYELNYKYM